MRCQTFLLLTFVPSLNMDDGRHTQQRDKPLLQHFGMWGGVLLRKSRKERVGLHTARD